MDDRIKLNKVDHLKFFLTILGIIVFVIISSIFITAFKMGCARKFTLAIEIGRGMML